MLATLVLMAWNPCFGQGPWIPKRYTEWDRGDVRQILYSSPWVRRFTRTTRALEFEVPHLGPSGMELRGYHAKESKEDGSETAEFYVRWVSSRTLRKASARRSALLQALPSTSEAHASAPLEEIQIAVTGRDMSSFEHSREAALKDKCFLYAGTKRRASPSHTEIARSAGGKIRGILFRFPRRIADGEPLISSHDTKVLFVTYGGEIEIRVTFNPQTMVDGKGTDL